MKQHVRLRAWRTRTQDFCVLLHGRKYVLLASSTRVEQGDDSTTTLQTLPTMKSMSLHLARAPLFPPQHLLLRFAWKEWPPDGLPTLATRSLLAVVSYT
jgi:hypothetical protein